MLTTGEKAPEESSFGTLGEEIGSFVQLLSEMSTPEGGFNGAKLSEFIERIFDFLIPCFL